MVPFEAMKPVVPTEASLAETMGALLRSVQEASDGAALRSALDAFDAERRSLSTWNSLVFVHFHQNTKDAEAEQARAYLDALKPLVTEHEVAIKRALLEHPHFPAIEGVLGEAVVAQWRADLRAFHPSIKDDLAEEARLDAEYASLRASAEIEFDGETLNLTGISRWMEASDRDVRERATRAHWAFFEEHGEAFDRIYDELVKLRTGMARKLGMEDFVELGYLRMHRVDYDRNDVEVFRRQVRDEVVPLAARLREQQRERLGVEKLRLWDEPLFDLLGNPAPQGDGAWMQDRAERMFDEVSPRMSAFYRMMREGNLLDLENRPAKAGGGFCTTFDTYGVPFIFANFNGTKHDATVFTHEAGHAFQAWSSRNNAVIDHIWPTSESAEIHSMSLEFLTWPWMELFFEEDADRFRRVHLTESLLFLPYGVAVDHFQHLVYERPDATPEERHAMWREMERTYLPWRDAGGIERVERGAFWQKQLHIYSGPFYYIDYTLALTVALQFWTWSQRDRASAMEAYHALCERGGRDAFRTLVASTGLKTPFEAGVLTEAVRQAAEFLGVDGVA